MRPLAGLRGEAPDDPSHGPFATYLRGLVLDVPGLPGEQDRDAPDRATTRPAPALDGPDLAGHGLEEDDEVDIGDVQPFLRHAAGDEDRELTRAEPGQDVGLFLLVHPFVLGVPGRLAHEPADRPPLLFEPILDRLDRIPVLGEDEDAGRALSGPAQHFPHESDEGVELRVGGFLRHAKELLRLRPGARHLRKLEEGEVAPGGLRLRPHPLQVLEERGETLRFEPLLRVVEVEEDELVEEGANRRTIGPGRAKISARSAIRSLTVNEPMGFFRK